MIHACYGMNCPYELPSGECKKAGHVTTCPVDMTPEEAEDAAAEEEYWRDVRDEARKEARLYGN